MHCSQGTGQQGYDAMIAALRSVFERHQQDGLINFSYDAKLYYGRFK